MDIKIALAEADELKSDIRNERNSIDELRASIQEQVDNHFENIKFAQQMRLNAAESVLDGLGSKALHDPESAGLIYEVDYSADYNLSKGFRHKITSLFRSIPLVIGAGGSMYYPLDEEDKPEEFVHVTVTQLGVPRNVRDEDVESCVEQLTPILDAQLALKGEREGNLIIDILDDTFSEHGSYTVNVYDEGYQLVVRVYGHVEELTEVTDLGTVIRTMSKKCPYGEYKD